MKKYGLARAKQPINAPKVGVSLPSGKKVKMKEARKGSEGAAHNGTNS